MAFSTQKDLLHVPFMNERPEPACPSMDAVNLKKYSSSLDERAWIPDDNKQSQYIADLTACRMYPRDDGGCGQGSSPSEVNLSRKCSTTDQKCGSCADSCVDEQSIGRDSVIGATIDVMRNIESMCLDS